MKGSVRFSTRTSASTGIAAAANWPTSFSAGCSPPGRMSSIAPDDRDRDRAADDAARLLAGGHEEERGHQHGGEDRQAAEPRHRALVQVALARMVHHAHAGCEPRYRRRDGERDHGGDEERP